MCSILGDVKQWFSDKGDSTLRLNYNLDANSVVFDVGGYEGWFTEQINNRYSSIIYCFEPLPEYYEKIKNKFSHSCNIMVLPLAVSDQIGEDIIYFNNNASSTHIVHGEPVKINCVTVDSVMKKNNIGYIDLLKINIEGEEYKLLEYMIKHDLIKNCGNIQVQFHKIVDNWEGRYEIIKKELEKTHRITYRYPFVWENWEIIKN